MLFILIIIFFLYLENEVDNLWGVLENEYIRQKKLEIMLKQIQKNNNNNNNNL